MIFYKKRSPMLRKTPLDIFSGMSGIKIKIFDLTQLFVGAQGTLGMFLEGDLELVPVRKHREICSSYLHDTSHLGQIITEVLRLNPESFESYDDNTLKLALRYFPEFAKKLGFFGMVQAGVAFLPAFLTSSRAKSSQTGTSS